MALKEIALAYTPPIGPLVPRPALYVFSYVASALYLLENAIWAWKTGEKTAEVDLEVFRRWVEENGLQTSIHDTQRARNDTSKRNSMDTKIVYGDDFEMAAALDASSEGYVRAQL